MYFHYPCNYRLSLFFLFFSHCHETKFQAVPCLALVAHLKVPLCLSYRLFHDVLMEGEFGLFA